MASTDSWSSRGDENPERRRRARPRPRLRPFRRNRVDVLGVPVALVDQEAWLAVIASWIEMRTQGLAVGVNAALRNQVVDKPRLARALMAADLAYPDGQSVVWALRVLGWPSKERLATTEMVHPLCEMLADAGHSAFLFGGAPGTAQAAADELVRLHPGFTVAGTEHGFIPQKSHSDLVSRINGSGARVLLVGLGDPLQQYWVQEHRDELTVDAILTCGGLFDWLSGKHRRPPNWMVGAGLEWLWRLALEPRRLARRYLLGNPRFVGAMLAGLLTGARRNPSEPAQPRVTPWP